MEGHIYTWTGAHVYATGGSPYAIMAASSDPEALVADKLAKIYQTFGVQPVSSDTISR